MRYTNKQYAAAFLSALKDKSGKERTEILRRFLTLLQKNKDWPRLNLILREAEKFYLRKSGLKKVFLETAQPASPNVKKEVEKILGRKIVLSEKINPAILAGIKILVDDELLIDSSAQSRLRKLFSRS